jgi:hypothetical protein
MNLLHSLRSLSTDLGFLFVLLLRSPHLVLGHLWRHFGRVDKCKTPKQKPDYRMRSEFSKVETPRVEGKE